MERRFTRSAQESHSKKNNAFELQARLSNMKRSGEGYVTCPYFERLHSILRGDASVTSRRVADSLQIIDELPLLVAVQATAVEGTQDTATLHFTPVVEEIKRSSVQGVVAFFPIA